MASKKPANLSNPIAKWKIDLGFKKDHVLRTTLDPPAYSPGGVVHAVTESASSDRAEQQHLITKRSWEMALGPLKQIPMNMFVMYMAGSSISIFPIMMVGMMAIRPIKALFSLQATFKPLMGTAGNETGSLILQKIVFVIGNVCAIGIAVYKCHSMGLLPTHASDWLDFVEAPQVVEFSGGGWSFS